MKTTATTLGLVIASAFVAQVAQAGFIYETTAPDASNRSFAVTAPRNVNPSAGVERIARGNRQRIDLESRVSSLITQSGSAPSELQSLRGMGRQVSLEDALRQILPAGWSVFSDQDAPLSTLVDWQGIRTWPLVLHSVLAKLDMRAHLDWDTQELMLFVPAIKAPPVTPALAVAPSVDASMNTKVPPVVAPSVVAPPVVAPPVVVAPKVAVKEVVWDIKPGSLRESLRVLAAEAGWTLVWNATIGDMTVDYDVETPGYQFTGAIVGAEGVIARVVDLYAQAEHPLAVTFFGGNKVVEIRLHDTPAATPTASAIVAAPLAQ